MPTPKTYSISYAPQIPEAVKKSRKPRWVHRILTRSGRYQLDLVKFFYLAAIFVAVPYYVLGAFSLVPLEGVWYDTMQAVGFLLLALCVTFMFLWNGNTDN